LTIGDEAECKQNEQGNMQHCTCMAYEPMWSG